MGAEATLAELVDGAYAAAMDDSLWLNWSERLLATLGGSIGDFVVLDITTGAVERMTHINASAKVVEEHEALGLVELDPQVVPFGANRTRSGFYLDTDHVDLSNPKTAEFMRWMNGNAGVNHHMTMVAPLRRGHLHAGVSMHRRVADGATPVTEQEKLAAILPEITRAMQLAFVHGEKLRDSYWSGLMASRAEATLLLDEHGRVLRLTEGMTRLLARDEALDIVGGRLRAASPPDDARLQAMLGQSVARDRPRSGALRVARRLGGPPLILTAFPLPRVSRVLAPAEAAALVTVVDPAAAPSTPADLWRQAFGLTPRESELAALLMAGHSVESATATLSITDPTARIHLRRLLAKTDTTRQADLMRLLGRLGGAPGGGV